LASVEKPARLFNVNCVQNDAIYGSLRIFLIDRHMDDTNSLIEQRKAKLAALHAKGSRGEKFVT